MSTNAQPPAGTLNVSKVLKRQGLDPHQIYHAKVINNNDPRQLGRVQARVETIFDGIEDNDLPWAIPTFKHWDGAYNPGGSADDRSGTFYVPKNKHSVGLRFQDGDPHRPVWCEYTVDEETALPERKPNYPDRAVWKFSNGMYIIVDTKTNEVFFNNPGDLQMTILGDVHQFIKGDQTMTVSKRYGDIDPYLINAPDTVLANLKSNPMKKVKWKGLIAGGEGNSHSHITGDQSMVIEGNRKTQILGYDHTEVQKFQREHVKLGHIHVSQRMDNN